MRVSLKQMFPGQTPREDFYTADVMTRRPEQLSVQEFVELTNYVGAELERLQAEKNSQKDGWRAKEALNVWRLRKICLYLWLEL